MNAVLQTPNPPSRNSQRVVLIALLAVAMAFATLTEGNWQWNGTPARVVLALLGTAAFAALWKLTTLPVTPDDTALASAPTPPNDLNGAGELPVFFASQTGTAETLARQTAEQLSRAGQAARARSLEDLGREEFETLRRALFIVSTTDEGDPPYPIAGFVRRVLEASADLSQLRFGLLALGDSYYDTFCGFGRRLDGWLIAQGATRAFARIDVDDNDPKALAVWQERMAEWAGASLSAPAAASAFHPWRLCARKELNPGSLGEPVFRIDLQPMEGTVPTWRAGDIAEILPRHAKTVVDAWLATTQLDGNTRLPNDDQCLRERLSRSELPDVDHVRGQTALQVAQALVALRHRDYSIASLPADGRIELVIRQGRRPDGSVSLGAGWLTQHASADDVIELRLRSNPNFRAPADSTPLILIGNGTGLAGLRALLRERVAQGRLRNWLIFGERQRARDFYYGDELEAALAKGQLAHMDLAFSRDTPDRFYVQHCLDANADRLREWVNAGAWICVCGSQEGMAGAVDASLCRHLGDATVQSLIETGRYRRDVY
jgi:sulfite reductase (NADPH) flavoprotein alpha-component